MKYIGILLLLFIYLFSSSIGQNVELNALVVTFESGSSTFDYYVDTFNKYSKENNLNVKINLEQITEKNPHYTLYNNGYIIENLLKKSTKYDIYFFDNEYTQEYGPYLLNLKDHIEEKHINMYNPEILSVIAYYNEHLVGLVKLTIFIF